MTPARTYRRTLPALAPAALALALLLALSACASTAAEGDGSPRGTQNRIIQAELMELEELTALQAIQRLRPRWLRTRLGRQPAVVLSGNPGQDLGVLRSVRARDVREMRFLSASDATTRYGTGYDGGAIVVELRGG